ncbi:helix-turn-helix domain-containing protein [Streptomyces sp. CA-111067]|uniref:helix-turn-helix domain-containing protein n=1 Tax=Streptomyces sp. CA-111067 TaxID=3240046 RepID=UPI003D95A95F
MRYDLLLALRTERGWTQEELSARSGISVRTIRNLERGRIHTPRRSSLELLFSVLDPELHGGADELGAGRTGPGEGAGPRTATGPAAGVPGGPGGSGVLPVGMPGLGIGSPAGPRFRRPGGRPPARWRGPHPPRTALVGRDPDLDRLSELVTGSPVTVLTGPGGAGKTRLALSVAARTAVRFRGGVAVAQLGAIRAVPNGSGGSGDWAGDPETRADGLAALAAAQHAVGELLGGDRQPADGYPALLILDTAEHLPCVTARLVEQLRESWPDLHLMITTRRPPVLPEARIWETAPLAESAAIELMRMRLASSSLAADLTCRPGAVRDLCRQLDHLPRLIEFAAYWLRSMPVSALLAPEHALELLGFPDFSLLPHQRSLPASLEWSWNLLTDRQRAFMHRLADLPQPVLGDTPGLAAPEEGLTGADAVRLLAELADASMLQLHRGAVYEYRMLRHVRTFVTRQRTPSPGPRQAAQPTPF